MGGILLAVIPFREEAKVTETSFQMSDWNASWYYLLDDPSEEGFTESFLSTHAIYLGDSTIPAMFNYSWGGSPIFGGFSCPVGFIATAEVNMPIDGYVEFEVLSGDGARLYLDGENIIDIWGTMWGTGTKSKSKILYVKAGRHELKLELYCWDWGVAMFRTSKRIITLERKPEPLIGLGVACLGIALIVVSKVKFSTSLQKPQPKSRIKFVQ